MSTQQRKTAKSPDGRAKFIRRFDDLTDAEKEAEYRSVGRWFEPSETTPLTAAERRQVRAAQAGLKTRAAGRQANGRPAADVPGRVTVPIEAALLREVDAYADAHRLDRSSLITLGLRLAMALPADRIEAAVTGLAGVAALVEAVGRLERPPVGRRRPARR